MIINMIDMGQEWDKHRIISGKNANTVG